MMKCFLCVTLAIVAIGLVAAKNLISQDAALISAGLRTLKFEPLAGKPDVIGAPPKFKVTRQTIEYLEKLRKDGATIEVQNNGSVSVASAKK
jgi:hypothetical protein